MFAWRDVGIDTTGLGKTVIETMPYIAQAIVAAAPEIRDQDQFERKILTIRKQVLNSVAALADAARHAGAAGILYPVLLDPHARL